MEELHRRNLNIPDEYYHQESQESRAPIPEYNLPRHTSHDLKIKKKPAVAAAGKPPSAHHRKGWGGSAKALNITVKGKADSQSCYDHEDDISEDIVDNNDNVGGEGTGTSLHLKLDSSQEKVPVGLSTPKITIGQPLKSAGSAITIPGKKATTRKVTQPRKEYSTCGSGQPMLETSVRSRVTKSSAQSLIQGKY